MNKRFFAASAAAVFVAAPLLAMPNAAAAIPSDLFVTFTGEPAGNKADGYAPAAYPDVHFSDTAGGSQLAVNDYGVQSNGLAVAAHGVGNNALEIQLANPSTKISLAFGNDDGGIVNATSQARLTAFRGATQVGQTLKNVNANDLMDQRISFQNKLFNRVVFQYVDAAENPVGLAEVVDDIEVNPLCTVVGTPNNDPNLNGTPASDVICGDTGVDVIKGLGGDDLIYSGPGNDKSRGGSGNDHVNGGPGKDKLYGEAGHDRLHGGEQKDRCTGGTGADVGLLCEVKIGIP